jgi:hypothetical protein
VFQGEGNGRAKLTFTTDTSNECKRWRRADIEHERLLIGQRTVYPGNTVSRGASGAATSSMLLAEEHLGLGTARRRYGKHRGSAAWRRENNIPGQVYTGTVYS